MIKRLQIVKIRELALALQQAKAARVVVGKCADLQVHRVGKRPPDNLARTIVDQQAVAVMHRRAKVREPLAHGVIAQKHRR